MGCVAQLLQLLLVPRRRATAWWTTASDQLQWRPKGRRQQSCRQAWCACVSRESKVRACGTLQGG